MKVLAVDTSAKMASVALCDENGIIAEFSLCTKLTHSQHLMPLIKDMLAYASIAPSEIDIFAVSSGPGSFTGLRIGVTTIKTMAYSFNKPVATVNTLDALAYNVIVGDYNVCPMLDARNNNVFCAIYGKESLEDVKQCSTDVEQYAKDLKQDSEDVKQYAEDDKQCSTGGKKDSEDVKHYYDLVEDCRHVLISEYMNVEIKDLIAQIKSSNRPTVFVGDGARLHGTLLANELGVLAKFAPANALLQRASSVALLAMRMQREAKLSDSVNAVPDYMRKSQAEQEQERRVRMELQRQELESL